MINEEIIRQILNEVVVDESIKNISNDAIFKDSGIDSLDHANILFSLQEKYGLIIPDSDVEKCNTINNILQYAKDHGKAG
ncbi:acyl carrier protein [Thiofilum flexile]|uniref:acyl carrier protein n=1 Tax=Thiofilum flexile TaxID=125627 RepID=UPI0003630EDE|nr:acyl carrier protein [Thiofilum flexile]